MADQQKYLASATVTFDAPRGDIWALWADVIGWPNWNSAVKSAQLDGKFRPGSKITLELASGNTAIATLVSVAQGEEFTDETVLPIGTIRNRHQMIPLGGLVKVTHEIEAEIDPDASTRFTTDVWPQLQAGLAASLLELADLAEV